MLRLLYYHKQAPWLMQNFRTEEVQFRMPFLKKPRASLNCPSNISANPDIK